MSLTPSPFQQTDLHPHLAAALERRGFSALTPVQEAMLPPALSGRDVLAVAPTGSGKTAAFVLPLAQRLLKDKPSRERLRRRDHAWRLRALVLTPTRELAQQVAAEATWIMGGTLLRSTAIWGKSAIGPQRRAIAGGVDLLVGTPGRVRELLDDGSLTLAFVQAVVVDEADRMLDMGFLPQVEQLLGRIAGTPQVLFLSATMPGEVETLARKFLKEPARVEVSGAPPRDEDAGTTVVRVADANKPAALMALLEEGPRRGVLVFVRTRRRAGWVGEALRRHGVTVDVLHGDRSQARRQAALAALKGGTIRVLVATDVAARGLHVPRVRTVVHYDLPLVAEDLVHRSGRAGHGGGFAESLVLLDDAERGRWQGLRGAVSGEVREVPAPDWSAWVPARPRATPKRAAAPAPRRRQERPATPERRQRPERPGRPEARERPERPGRKEQRPERSAEVLRGRMRRKPLTKGEKPGRGVRPPRPGPS